MADVATEVNPDDPVETDQIVAQAGLQDWKVVNHAGRPVLLHRMLATNDADEATMKALGIDYAVPLSALGRGSLRNLVVMMAPSSTVDKGEILSAVGKVLDGGSSSQPTAADGPPDGPPNKPPDNPPNGVAVTATVDPLHAFQDRMWEVLGPAQRSALAENYFEASIRSLSWAGAPGLTLLDKIDDTTDLRKRWFLAVAGLTSDQAASDDIDLELRKKRVKLAKVGIDTATEAKNQMIRWTALSKWVPGLLIAGLVIAVVAMGEAFRLTNAGHIDGPTLALIIFVLAIFAISPAVLLLIERPLKGLDSFTPSAPAAPAAPTPGATGT